MKIDIDKNEFIDLSQFELGWRWDNDHNSTLTENEKSLIKPLSITESKRVNKIIAYFEIEQNLKSDYHENDWLSANCESYIKINLFRDKLSSILDAYDEDVIISWNRKTTLTTPKNIFLKYWDDFLYSGSDDVTVISKNTNWVLFYRHIGVVKVWKKAKSISP